MRTSETAHRYPNDVREIILMVMVISAELSMNFTVHIYIRNTFLTFRKKEKKRKNTWKDLTNCRFKKFFLSYIPGI